MSFIVIFGQIVGGRGRPFTTEWTRDMERRIPYTVLNEHRRTVTLPYAQRDFK